MRRSSERWSSSLFFGVDHVFFAGCLFERGRSASVDSDRLLRTASAGSAVLRVVLRLRTKGALLHIVPATKHFHPFGVHLESCAPTFVGADVGVGVVSPPEGQGREVKRTFIGGIDLNREKRRVSRWVRRKNVE